VADDTVPFPTDCVARSANAWMSEAASAGFGEACAAALADGTGIVDGDPGMGAVGPRRNILSIVGRRAAPKGVERKSDGRSLIHEGIDPPVRKPIQSFVKELQLKSKQRRQPKSAFKIKQSTPRR
jgi:hypothetical protein